MSFIEMHPETKSDHRPNGAIVELSNGVKLSRKQRKMLSYAMKVAETSDIASFKHGAVVVRGGAVLGFGVNKKRAVNGIPVMFEYNPDVTVHAEIDALSRISDAAGSVIYIARVNAAGEPKMSRPCERCEVALNAAGVKRVIYTVPS